MDFLNGKTLLHKGEVPINADVAFKKKNLVLFYFTVIESESCRNFDMKLYNLYEEALLRKVELGIVVISCDNDKELYKNNMKSNYNDFYSLQFDDELSNILTYNYGVSHVPSLIVVRKNGALVTKEGVKDIEEIGLNVLVTWAE